MKLRLAADDIIIALLELAEIDDDTFTSDRETIHRAFYMLKKENPKVMAKFNFRERELFPESFELDQALSNLDSCGLIERYNNIPRYYKINRNKIKAVFSKFSKGLILDNDISIEDVEKLAKSFAGHLAIKVLGETYGIKLNESAHAISRVPV